MLRFLSIQIVISLLVSLQSVESMAQIISGNGGDVVICSGKPGAELLDFYVGRRNLNLLPRLGRIEKLEYNESAPNFDQLLPVLPIVEYWLEQLARLDPDRAVQYTEVLRQFPDQWRLLKDQDFDDINDLGDILIERNCRLEQIAVQQRPTSRFDGHYLVSQKLWDLTTDVLQRAGLLLHEIVYRDAIRRGHSDSYRVRRLVALISDTEALAQMTPEQFEQEVVNLLLNTYQDHQLKVPTSYFESTFWVLYKDVVSGIRAANDICVNRLGNGATAGFSPMGRRKIDPYLAIAGHVKDRQQPLIFWHINGVGETQRWRFDGWNTEKIEAEGTGQVLCSWTTAR